MPFYYFPQFKEEEFKEGQKIRFPQGIIRHDKRMGAYDIWRIHEHEVKVFTNSTYENPFYSRMIGEWFVKIYNPKNRDYNINTDQFILKEDHYKEEILITVPEWVKERKPEYLFQDDDDNNEETEYLFNDNDNEKEQYEEKKVEISNNKRIVDNLGSNPKIKSNQTIYKKKQMNIFDLDKTGLYKIVQNVGLYNYRRLKFEKPNTKKLIQTILSAKVRNLREVAKYLNIPLSKKVDKKYIRLNKRELIKKIKGESINKYVIEQEDITNQINESYAFVENVDEIKKRKKRFIKVSQALGRTKLYSDSLLRDGDNKHSENAQITSKYDYNEYINKIKVDCSNFLRKIGRKIEITKIQYKATIEIKKSEVDQDGGKKLLSKVYRPSIIFTNKNEITELEGYAEKVRTEIKLFFDQTHIEHVELDKKRVEASDRELEMIREGLAEEDQETKKADPVGSGWVFSRFLSFEISVSAYNPLRGSSYVKMPQFMISKQCFINVENKKFKSDIVKNEIIKNSDNNCFVFAFLAAKHHQKQHCQRMNVYYKYIDLYNWDGINFPASVEDIKLFERNNNEKINVFEIKTIEGELNYKVYSLHYNNEDPFNALNIGLYEGHYVTIKNLNSLFRTKGGRTKFVCVKCMHSATSEIKLKEHYEYCKTQCVGKVEMPKEGSIMKFKNYKNMLKVPFAIYADFESCIEEYNDDSKTGTVKYSKHYGCSYAYKVCSSVSEEWNNSEIKTYKQDNHVKIPAAEMFCKSIKETVKQINDWKIDNGKKNYNLTLEEEKEFKKSKKCYLCEESYTHDNYKVRDHCHFTGKYRGASHRNCNLVFKESRKIPVVFHNLKGYDSHLILQTLGKYFKKESFNIISKTDEKYLCFSVGNITFIDSFAFLASSLEQLASLLDKQNDFKYLEKHFGKNSNTDLLKMKGVFPYEWFDSIHKFHFNGLPKPVCFYSSLNNTQINDEDYSRAQTVYKSFNCETFGDYHDIYLKTDVLILADIFEKFRNQCLNDYKLDPLNYVSLPSFGWDAMLNMTKVKLELLSSQDMYEFYEKNIRGGVSMICGLRHAVANNKYMTSFDKQKISSFLMYIDCNNLYGKSMTQKLPYKNFEWINENEIQEMGLSAQSLENFKNKYNKGFAIEVDVDYPDHLHDAHNDFPLLPEKIAAENNMLSEYQYNLKKKYYGVKNSKGEIKVQDEKIKKLIPNLNNKEKYVIHSDTLIYALSKGLILKKIHKGIKYDEKEWLEPYIRFNSNKRANTNDSFLKDFYKLMNNAVYGISMMNVRNFQDAELVSSPERFDKLIRKNNLKGIKIFNNDLVLINKYKKQVDLNRPIYTGFSILEHSKLHMQKFYYDYLKVKYGEKVRLCMTDTDSFIIYVESSDINKPIDLYEDMYNDRESYYDLSNFPNDHFIIKKCREDFEKKYTFKSKEEYDKNFSKYLNKAIIGMFKVETSNVPIKEFIGMQSKTYSLKLDDKKQTQKNTAKGVKKNVKKEILKHELYHQIRNTEGLQMVQQNTFKSDKHEIYTISTTKKGLSAYDDKRYLINQDKSYAYGHYSNRK